MKKYYCKTHSDQEILFICLNKNCNLNTRKVCFQCMKNEHAQHLTSFVSIENFFENLNEEIVKKEL